MLKKIEQPNGNGTPWALAEVEKDEDGDLQIEVKDCESCNASLAWFDPHRARQLYNAIGEVMGFDKPAKTRSAPKGKQEYKGNGKHKWELVTADPKGAGHTYRLRVPGGWLFRTVSTYPGEGENPGDGDPIAVAQSFVPVPDVVGYAV